MASGQSSELPNLVNLIKTLTLPQLKDLLRSEGLPVSGKKAAVQVRIIDCQFAPLPLLLPLFYLLPPPNTRALSLSPICIFDQFVYEHTLLSKITASTSKSNTSFAGTDYRYQISRSGATLSFGRKQHSI